MLSRRKHEGRGKDHPASLNTHFTTSEILLTVIPAPKYRKDINDLRRVQLRTTVMFRGTISKLECIQSQTQSNPA